MQILHETDVPYIIVDKASDMFHIKLDVAGENEEDLLAEAFILYGDSYDYEDDKNFNWQYRKAQMNLRYAIESKQTWDIEFKVPEWKRLKYTFLIRKRSGDEYLLNEYGMKKKDAISWNQLLNTYHSHFFYPYVFDEDLIQYPEWVNSTVWYQIFPDRFKRGEIDENVPGLCQWDNENPEKNSWYGGDIRGIINGLDYLEGLGINGIYLTPIFKAASVHKYDTIDYFEIDPAFGTKEDFRELVSEAHEKGIKIMLDGVFNHTSHLHPMWQDVLRKQEQSEYNDWYCINRFPVETSVVYSKELNYETFSFVAIMPKLNYENPEVKEYVMSIIEYWIKEFDIDGWRFDVGNELSFQFYNEMKERLRKIRKDIYLIAEIWHDPNRWLRQGYIDATMNYLLCSAINEYAIEKSISVSEFNDRFFHQLNRLSSVHAGLSFNLLDSHDTKRVLTAAAGDVIRVRNAFLLMFLMPGSPCIYYGTEIGLAGGPDPDNRRPMIWKPEEWDQSQVSFFQKLILFRRDNWKWIQRANIEYVRGDRHASWRMTRDNITYILRHNISGQEQIVPSDKNILFNTCEKGNLMVPDSMLLYQE